jgi:hypothetical protein
MLNINNTDLLKNPFVKAIIGSNDIDAQDLSYSKILTDKNVSIFKGQFRLVQEIIEIAKLNIADLQPAIDHPLTREREPSTLYLLCLKKQDLTADSPFRNYAACIANEAGDRDLQEPFDTPQYYNQHDFDLICCAALAGNVSALERLIFKLNPTQSKLDQALIFAAANNHESACELLLAKGANPLFKDNDGKNAIDWALKYRDMDGKDNKNLIRRVLGQPNLVKPNLGEPKEIKDVPTHIKQASSNVKCKPIQTENFLSLPTPHLTSFKTPTEKWDKLSAENQDFVKTYHELKSFNNLTELTKLFSKKHPFDTTLLRVDYLILQNKEREAYTLLEQFIETKGFDDEFELLILVVHLETKLKIPHKPEKKRHPFFKVAYAVYYQFIEKRMPANFGSKEPLYTMISLPVFLRLYYDGKDLKECLNYLDHLEKFAEIKFPYAPTFPFDFVIYHLILIEGCARFKQSDPASKKAILDRRESCFKGLKNSAPGVFITELAVLLFSTFVDPDDLHSFCQKLEKNHPFKPWLELIVNHFEKEDIKQLFLITKLLFTTFLRPTPLYRAPKSINLYQSIKLSIHKKPLSKEVYKILHDTLIKTCCSPTNCDFFLLNGLLAQKLELKDASITFYSKALKHEDENQRAEAHYHLANYHMEKFEIEKAEPHLQFFMVSNAFISHDLSYLAYIMFFWCKLSFGKEDEAWSAINKIIKILEKTGNTTDLENVKNDLYHYYLYVKKYQEIIQEFQAGATDQPYTRLLFLLAKLTINPSNEAILKEVNGLITDKNINKSINLHLVYWYITSQFDKIVDNFKKLQEDDKFQKKSLNYYTWEYILEAMIVTQSFELLKLNIDTLPQYVQKSPYVIWARAETKFKEGKIKDVIAALALMEKASTSLDQNPRFAARKTVMETAKNAAEEKKQQIAITNKAAKPVPVQSAITPTYTDEPKSKQPRVENPDDFINKKIAEEAERFVQEKKAQKKADKKRQKAHQDKADKTNTPKEIFEQYTWKQYEKLLAKTDLPTPQTTKPAEQKAPAKASAKGTLSSTQRAKLIAQTATTHQPTATSAAAAAVVHEQPRFTATSAMGPVTASNLGYLESAKRTFIWVQERLKNWQEAKIFTNDTINHNELLYVLFKLSETLYRFNEFQSFASMRHTIRHAPQVFTVDVIKGIVKELEKREFLKVINTLCDNPSLGVGFPAPQFVRPLTPSNEELIARIKKHLVLFEKYEKWCGEHFQDLERNPHLRAAICGSILIIADAVNTLRDEYKICIKDLDFLVVASNRLAHPNSDPQVLKMAEVNALLTKDIKEVLKLRPNCLDKLSAGVKK